MGLSHSERASALRGNRVLPRIQSAQLWVVQTGYWFRFTQKRQLLRIAGLRALQISWKRDAVVVVAVGGAGGGGGVVPSGHSAGRRSCPGFWPLLPHSGFLWGCLFCAAECEELERWTHHSAEKDLWNMVLLRSFFSVMHCIYNNR